MRTFPALLALFIAIPLIEIFLFIKVGGAIGALPTVVLVVVTAVIGVALLRAQGLRTMTKFQHQIASGEMPANTMLEGAALLFGGALLLTPGFLTDTIGFLCLIPITRQGIIRWLASNMVMNSSAGLYSSHSVRKSDPDVIEGEFKAQDKGPRE